MSHHYLADSKALVDFNQCNVISKCNINVNDACASNESLNPFEFQILGKLGAQGVFFFFFFPPFDCLGNKEIHLGFLFWAYDTPD